MPKRLILLAPLCVSLLIAVPTPFLPQLATQAEAAENKRFTPQEMGIAFLDPEGLASSSENDLNQFFNYSRKISSRLPAVVRKQLDPVHKEIDKIKAGIFDIATTQSSEVQPHMEAYAPVFDIPLDYQELGYMRKLSLKQLSEDANSVLQRGYKVSYGVILSDTLLPALNKELPQIKSASNHHKAAIGIAAVTLLNLALQSQVNAAEIEPDYKSLQARLETQAKSVQRKIEANPLQALSMGEELKLLLDLTSSVNDSAGKVGEAAQKLPNLISSATGVVGSVSKAF